MNSNTNITFAPILIPTLCRYNHFVRCVESLKNNTWAKYTDVYIALDYPIKESHWDGYNKISKYIESDFSQFKSFNVIKREFNYGSGRNMRELRNYVFEKHDRIIRTDDDAEFSANFLEYMNKCLMHYEKNENVIAITGYSYPLNWILEDGANVFESNFICPMWGTGFWKDKFYEIENEIENGYLKKMANKYLKIWKKPKLTDARYLDYVNGVLSWDESNLIEKMTDVSLGIYISLKEKTVVMPVISKVRNNGFDGTGVYCQNTKLETDNSLTLNANNYDYSMQYIDKEDYFSLIPSSQNNFEINKNILNDFDSRDKNLMIKAKVKIILYKMLSERMYKKIWLTKNNHREKES